MKKNLLLFSFLCINFSLLAQEQWEKHTTIADSLDLEMQFHESLPFRAKALEAAKNQPDSIQKMLLGLQMFTQAELDFSKGSQAYSDAYTLMKNAVDTLQKVKASPKRMTKVNRRLAENAFDYMYHQQDAERYLENAFSYFEKAPEKDTIYLIEMMQFSSYMKILARNYDEAIEISEKGIELIDSLNLKSNKKYELKERLLYNLGLVHSTPFLDIPPKEYQYTLESERVLNKMKNPDVEALVMIYRRYALFERDFRNYYKAKRYMQKAMSLYKKNKTELRAKPGVGFKQELSLYNTLIFIYIDTQEEQKILENLAEVEALVNNNKLDEVEKAYYKGTLNFVTKYYLQEDMPDKAMKYIEKALAVHIDLSKSPYLLDKYNQENQINYITVSFLKKEYQKVMKLITQLEKTNNNHIGLKKQLTGLKAKSLLGINNYEEAIDAINQLLEIISKENQTFNFPESKIEAFTPGYVLTDSKGLVELTEAFRNYYGKYSREEEKLYWMALAQFENNIGNTPLNKTLKKTFDKITSGLMNAAMERNFSSEENNRLLNFIESIPSQNLINQFLLKREIAGNTQTYKLVEEEQYIRSYITFLKKEYQKSNDETIKQQLFEKEIELEKITEQLATQYRSNNPFTIPKIDVSAITDKNIIKFKVAGNELFKIQLNNGKLTYQKIENYSALKQEIENYLLNVNDLNSTISELKKQGEMLYQKLFPNDFNTKTSTVIIPDDILYYLPFELLVQNNEYLIENHTISYASNFYFINNKNTAENNSKNRKVAFFAPEYSGDIPESRLAVRGEAYSLLGAKEEVNQLAKFISGEVFIGNAASKTQFKSLENDISVLHMAMHANLNDKDPELSNLMFSTSEQDYEMYISELYGLNFNADLAVLSACNTGVGGFKDGGNLVSMHQAFTTAGIPATVASLWNAPDLSTKEIMLDFYKNLQHGEDKATALQNAKLNYLKNTQDPNLQHPFYWAGFVLSGDKSSVQLVAISFWQQHAVLLVSVGLLLLILLYFFMRKKIQKTT